MKIRHDDIDPALLEPSAPGAETEARERFVHGLLESLHSDTPEQTDRRINALMARLEGPIPIRAHRHHIRRWPLITTAAAAVALTFLVLLGLPTQRTALATVQQSIAASSTAGDRHYDISITRPEGAETERMATLDVRDPSHYVVRAASPQGDTVTLGKNGEESWAIHPDGTLERYPQRRILPPWINFGTSTVMLVAVDDLLATLERSYDLSRSDAAPVPGDGTTVCERITALHKGGSPEPNRVELWIDRSSHVVRRMELHWTQPPGRPGPRPDMRDVGRERPDSDPGPGPRGLQRDPLEEARFALDNGLPFPPPQDRQGPGGRRPGPPRDGMRAPPPGEEGGPAGDRPPPPEGEFDHPPPPESGDERPPPGPGRPRGPRPQFLDGPPDFARHPPPPRLIVFQLSEGAPFPQGWFDPGAHRHGDPSQK